MRASSSSSADERTAAGAAPERLRGAEAQREGRHFPPITSWRAGSTAPASVMGDEADSAARRVLQLQLILLPVDAAALVLHHKPYLHGGGLRRRGVFSPFRHCVWARITVPVRSR